MSKLLTGTLLKNKIFDNNVQFLQGIEWNTGIITTSSQGIPTQLPVSTLKLALVTPGPVAEVMICLVYAMPTCYQPVTLMMIHFQVIMSRHLVPVWSHCQPTLEVNVNHGFHVYK